MSTCVLFIWLLVILGLDYSLFKKIYHPSILFVFFFVLSVFNGILNYSSWDFELHWITVFVIGFGATIFSLFCLVTMKLTHKKNESGNVENQQIVVPLWIGVLSLLFVMVSSWLYWKAVVDVVVSNGGTSDMFRAMVEYDRLTKFSDVDTSIRGFVGQLYVAVQAISYVWMYIFLRNLFAERRKIEWMAIPNMVLSGLLPLVSGGRAGVITFVIAFVVMFLVFFTNQPQSFVKRYFKYICAGIITISVAGLLLFKPIVNLLGRDTGNETIFSYISLYLGAPIKNLDMYLSGTLVNPINVKSNFWGEQTFAILYGSFSHWTGNEVVKQWDVWQPYQEINGHSLGNVYTTYYPFIFDWGIIGAFVAVAIIAIVMQLIFELVENHRLMKYSSIKISTLVYCYASYGIVFSFYLNFLITTTVSSAFLRFILVWVFCSYALTLCNYVTNKIIKK